MSDPMKTKRWSVTRQGVRGVLTVETSKGKRPKDRHGWDTYEGPENVWTQERFERE